MNYYVEIIVTNNYFRFLNICKSKGIPLENIKFRKNSVSAKVDIKHLLQIKKVRLITKSHILIKKRSSLYNLFWKTRNRYFFIIGILIIVFIMLYYFNHIWKIKINGNITYSDTEIINYLKCNNIKISSKSKDVDCDELERMLRNDFDNISWVSVDLDGTALNINMCELIHSKVNLDNQPYDIVAACDGQIHSIITRYGTPIVKAGDIVKKGDVLVMSKVEALNESMELFNISYVNADADILIETEYDFYKCINREIILSKSEKKSILLSDEQLKMLLNINLNDYINNLSKNGIQILSNSVKIDINSENGIAMGKIKVLIRSDTKEKPVIAGTVEGNN